MTHFELMEQEGQMTIFEMLDECELLQFKRSKQSSTDVSKPIKKKRVNGPRKVGYIVRG